MGLTICINRNNYADNTQISNRNRLLSASHYGKSHQDMKNNRINNITNLSSPERYDYFIRKVSDFEEVWGLKDKEGWALIGS